MNKYIVGIVVVVFLALAGATTSCVVASAHHEAEFAQRDAAHERGKREALEKDYAVLTTKTSEQAAMNIQLAERVDALQRKLASRPVPAPPSPAPNTDPELTEGLVKAGFDSGLKIAEETPSTLFRPDAKLTWSWKEDAARVPGLEQHIAARVELETGFKTEIGGLKVEIQQRREGQAKCDSIVQAQGSEIVALQGVAKAAQKEAKAQHFNGWLKAAAALALGVGVGRASR